MSSIQPKPAVPDAVVEPARDDPFLWLEDVEGERALDWVREQNDAATAVLEADPRFAELPASVNSAVVYFDSDRTSARMGLIGDAWALEGIVKELEASTLNADQ